MKSQQPLQTQVPARHRKAPRCRRGKQRTETVEHLPILLLQMERSDPPSPNSDMGKNAAPKDAIKALSA